MRVLVSAINFGLGPSGKLCSIIRDAIARDDCFEWYACGDELDITIYKRNPFVESCWSKDPIVLSQFVRKNSITDAIVILDPEIALLLISIGVRVIYVDSIPFIWSKADVIPHDAMFYCAQKYPGYLQAKVLEGVKNLIWINPITINGLNAESETTKAGSKRDKEGYVVINFGGLHSPYGDSREYYEIIMNALLPIISEKIYITGGGDVIKLTHELFPKVHSKTYIHEDFLNLVSGAKLFITSPGLTTLYETCDMDINTIILPPQNLSQVFNAMWAEKICKRVKVIKWDRKELDVSFFSKCVEKTEEEKLRYMYNQIKKMSKDSEFLGIFNQRVAGTLSTEEYVTNTNQTKSNGADYILQLLYEMTNK